MCVCVCTLSTNTFQTVYYVISTYGMRIRMQFCMYSIYVYFSATEI